MMEENLRILETTYGAPASLFERSAAARAGASGSTTGAVVAAWVASSSPSPEAPPAVAPGDSSAPEPSGGDRVDEVGDGVDEVGDGLDEVGDGLDEAGDRVAPVFVGGSHSNAGLLAAVAKARGLPESLIERSATARAGAVGGSVDEVLREWAEEEGLDVGDFDEAVDTGDVVHSGEAVSGVGLLSTVAEALNMPESLVERSAEARAGFDEVELDDVLREWAEKVDADRT